MPYIIVKGKSSKDDWNKQKDYLHQRRKTLETDLRSSIFTKDKMNMVDCSTEQDEFRRTVEYDQWKAAKDKTGKSNEDKLREFQEINKEFKKHGEEGRKH